MRATLRASVIVLLFVGTSQPAAGLLSLREPGYHFKEFRRDASRIEVVSVVAGHGYRLAPMMAFPRFTGQRKTSSIGRTHHAFAAVNGDFRILRTNVAKHQSVIRGEIMTSGSVRSPGYVLAMNADSTQAWIRRPIFNVTVRQGSIGFRVYGWNSQQPAHGAVVAFTGRGGGAQPGPDGRWPQTRTCSAILKPRAHPRGIERTYIVTKLRRNCSRLPFQPPPHRLARVVLVGHDVRRLSRGPLEMTVNLGKGARNVIGGFPLLVRRGVNVAKNCEGRCSKSGSGPDAAFMARNPRTALGVSRGCSDRLPTKCKLFLVTVDGRQPSSEGVRLRPLAQIMKRLGAWSAVNLDGGGSSTMWLRDRTRGCRHRTRSGCLMNNPVYGERSILDAVGVVRR